MCVGIYICILFSSALFKSLFPKAFHWMVASKLFYSQFWKLQWLGIFIYPINWLVLVSSPHIPENKCIFYCCWMPGFNHYFNQNSCWCFVFLFLSVMNGMLISSQWSWLHLFVIFCLFVLASQYLLYIFWSYYGLNWVPQKAMSNFQTLKSVNINLFGNSLCIYKLRWSHTGLG